MDPSARTGAASTTELGVKPGCPTMGRDSCVRRSQLAVLLACQTPLKSGLLAMRPGVGAAFGAFVAGACAELRVATSEKKTAVTAATEPAMAQALPECRNAPTS